MHRKFLQEKLAEYCPIDENEERMRLDIINFVDQHPNCFDRALSQGHITGSAWVIDTERSHALLTQHRKLNRWLQLGGHSDGKSNTLNVALREAQEESGLSDISPLIETIFDVDVHLIPARKDEPEHQHYDIRFLFEADRNTPLVISEESNDLAWIELEKLADLTDDESILRMLRKTSW